MCYIALFWGVCVCVVCVSGPLSFLFPCHTDGTHNSHYGGLRDVQLRSWVSWTQRPVTDRSWTRTRSRTRPCKTRTRRRRRMMRTRRMKDLNFRTRSLQTRSVWRRDSGSTGRSWSSCCTVSVWSMTVICHGFL